MSTKARAEHRERDEVDPVRICCRKGGNLIKRRRVIATEGELLNCSAFVWEALLISDLSWLLSELETVKLWLPVVLS